MVYPHEIAQDMIEGQSNRISKLENEKNKLLQGARARNTSS